MKAKILSLLCACTLLFAVSSGCVSRIAPNKPVTTSQNAVSKQEKKVDDTLEKIDKVESQKRTQTATLAVGIQHSLIHVTNPPVEVKTALDLNDRIVSIMGTPHLDEVQRIKATVDLLNSAILEERKKGEALLAERDKQIVTLQKQKADLKEQYDDQMWEMTDKAKEIAKQSDAKQATIDTMGGMFGLNAVIWGLKKFFFSCLTFIIVGSVIFLILRILSATNPIAGAAFAIFNTIGTFVISLIKGLTPKAFEMSSLVHVNDSLKYKQPFVKIVDTIQSFKEKLKIMPDKVYTLQDILEELDVEMNESEKDLINDILVEQKWRKK